MKITISISIDDSIVQKTDEISSEEMRSRSNMVEILLKEAIENRELKSKKE